MFESTNSDSTVQDTDKKKFNIDMTNIRIRRPEDKKATRLATERKSSKRVNNVTSNNSETGKKFEESLNPYKF